MVSSPLITFLLFFCVASSFLVMISEGIDAGVMQQPGPTTCPVAKNDCGKECDRRCSATQHLNNCLLFCNKCCNVCLCVPPGTYGNKECCPCYNNWKTQEGGPKCP